MCFSQECYIGFEEWLPSPLDNRHCTCMGVIIFCMCCSLKSAMPQPLYSTLGTNVSFLASLPVCKLDAYAALTKATQNRIDRKIFV